MDNEIIRNSVLTGYDIRLSLCTDTGITVPCSHVYSIASGSVIQLDRYYDCYVISVQYNEHVVFRYTNMRNVNVRFGQIIPTGYDLGIPDEELHFEFASTEYSPYPVRISGLDFYKHNPYVVFTHSETLGEPGFLDEFSEESAHQTVF